MKLIAKIQTNTRDKEVIRTLYAIRCSKFPGANNIAQRLGIGRKAALTLLNNAHQAGLVESSQHGKRSVLHLLTLAGVAVLDKHLAANPAPPELCPAPIKCKPQRDRSIPLPETEELEDLRPVTPSRTYQNSTTKGRYSPGWERQTYRAGAFDHLQYKSSARCV